MTVLDKAKTRKTGLYKSKWAESKRGRSNLGEFGKEFKGTALFANITGSLHSEIVAFEMKILRI